MIVPSEVKEFIASALREDLGPGDITTSLTVSDTQTSRAELRAKGDFVLAGLPFAREVFLMVDGDIAFTPLLAEGTAVKNGEVVAEVGGRTASLLAAERVALNILQRLSGVATFTNDFVSSIRGLKAKILDTRKTSPGMRVIEKYAVRMGGGQNHRMGLYDGILIKDNHIRAAGGIREAVALAKEAHHLLKVEVEVEDIDGVNAALDAGVDIIMLDNMGLGEVKEAVLIASGRALLEVSGNVTLENVREIAETGVDMISVGALTHSAPAADISMRLL